MTMIISIYIAPFTKGYSALLPIITEVSGKSSSQNLDCLTVFMIRINNYYYKSLLKSRHNSGIPYAPYSFRVRIIGLGLGIRVRD